jgi:hypothetical protein
MKVICKDDTYHSNNNKPILIVGKQGDTLVSWFTI